MKNTNKNDANVCEQGRLLDYRQFGPLVTVAGAGVLWVRPLIWQL